MKEVTTKEYDNLFNDIIDLSERISDKSVKERLERAAEFVLMASQQALLGKSYSVDLVSLGVPNERVQDRRAGDRRHTR